MNKKLLVACGLSALWFCGSASAVTILSEDFNAGIPGTWSVVNAGGIVTWGLSGDAGNETGNWTSGTGTAASASSDVAGVGAYDTSLITESFSLVGFVSAVVDFNTNYQAIGQVPTNDNFDVDISTDGGATWITLLALDNDTPVGGLRAPPGVDQNVDLGAYLGEADLAVRWHYYNPSATAFDWYAQIDDVVISGDTASVPEPGTLALLGLGLAGVGFARRRRS